VQPGGQLADKRITSCFTSRNWLHSGERMKTAYGEISDKYFAPISDEKFQEMLLEDNDEISVKKVEFTASLADFYRETLVKIN
jgi:hypothetical protein